MSQETIFVTQPKPTYLTDTATPVVLPIKTDTPITENNNKVSGNDSISANRDKNIINEVWTKNNFNSRKVKQKLELNLNAKMSWTDERVDSDKSDEKNETESPQSSPSIASPVKDDNSRHARRPMNAFLIFCKKHRSVVKEKYPNSENRAVTRILGEWWAQLNTSDKAPYTNLAKEYKDAFFSANPDFKWYKLPAPPLRTLNTRPANAPKPSSPVLTSPINATSPRPEFTPGKLADESQLGSLTSLMNMNSGFNNNNNNNFSNNQNGTNKQDTVTNNNNNVKSGEDQAFDLSVKGPLNLSKSLPPKPIKKRIFEHYVEDTQNIFNFETNTHISANSMEQNSSEESFERNMTKQELLNKVVDSMFTPDEKGEPRKSERSCKGKRYEQFMVENKLLSSKRDKMLQQQYFDKKLEESFGKSDTPKLDLENTIKRLAERTHYKLEEGSVNVPETKTTKERTRSISETSDDNMKNVQNSFNLDLRISNLPSLSYDHYLQKKRESKKRKIRTKSESNDLKRNVINVPIGSKKRKNKQSITHLEKVPEGTCFTDLSGLATLAEIAAITEKINEK